MKKQVHIEFSYQRVPEKFVYSGSISMTSIPGSVPFNTVVSEFEKKDLQEMAVALHHLLRFCAVMGMEFTVNTSQKPPRGNRPAIPVYLTADQINKIYDSVETAKEFFAPIERVRKVQ